MLGALNWELKAYETLASQGEGLRTAARGFNFSLSLLSAEIKHVERELRDESGLIHPRESPLEALHGPLQNLRTISRQLNGPESWPRWYRYDCGWH